MIIFIIIIIIIIVKDIDVIVIGHRSEPWTFPELPVNTQQHNIQLLLVSIHCDQTAVIHESLGTQNSLRQRLALLSYYNYNTSTPFSDSS